MQKRSVRFLQASQAQVIRRNQAHQLIRRMLILMTQSEEEAKGGLALGQNEEERFRKFPLNLTCLHTSTLNINYTIHFLLME